MLAPQATTAWANASIAMSFFLSRGAENPDKQGLRWPDLRGGAQRRRCT